MFKLCLPGNPIPSAPGEPNERDICFAQLHFGKTREIHQTSVLGPARPRPGLHALLTDSF